MHPGRKPAATVAAISVFAIAGCGDDESSTEATTTNPAAGKNGRPQSAEQNPNFESNPDKVAQAYARKVSGGQYEYGGLGAAAYSGCLEGLLGEHVGPPGVSYQDEFPEPELQAVHEKARKDCASSGEP